MNNFTWTNKETLSIYKNRWQQLANNIPDNSLVYLYAGVNSYRNNDVEYPFRADSNFFYLTGFTEEKSSICLVKKNNNLTSIFFCLPKDESQEIWHGKRCGIETAKNQLEVDECYSIFDVNEVLKTLFIQVENIFIDFSNENFEIAQKILLDIKALQRQGHHAPNNISNLGNILEDLRIIKDNYEQDIMRKAGSISATAHINVMKKSKEGLSEYHLEAEILHTFREFGSESVAYNTIVATGENSCILHHRAGNSILKNDDLCLIDAGCELYGYASDITRTFPVSGKFSKEQAMMYEIVLNAQKSAIEKTKVGNTLDDIHNGAVKVLVQGMLDTKLLTNNYDNLEHAVASNDYKQFYMHRTSHWLGLDVHDIGKYKQNINQELKLDIDNKQSLNQIALAKPSTILQEGMCITIEPGIYIRPSKNVDSRFWNIGIRIEDDVFIHKNSCELYTREVPVEIYEIEKIMK